MAGGGIDTPTARSLLGIAADKVRQTSGPEWSSEREIAQHSERQFCGENRFDNPQWLARRGRFDGLSLPLWVRRAASLLIFVKENTWLVSQILSPSKAVNAPDRHSVAAFGDDRLFVMLQLP
jgi:hypothetical protein